MNRDDEISGTEQGALTAMEARYAAQLELFDEFAMEDEEDMGALRLLILQAVMKEKRILESQG